ncbi:MAG: response regulator [Stenotrophobium sp.]
MEEATAKSRVLFVDDEPRILSTMRMLFRGKHEMFFADSGTQALELLKTQIVDVIVSDQRMPGMTGIQLLRAARELNPNTMRILLTGYSDLNAIIGSINEGEIFRFVNKPWSNDDLTTTVARAVTAARTSMAAAQHGDAALAAAATGAAAPGVLVLDDDATVPTRIQAILGKEFRVFGATTMEQAVHLLEHDNIGVVISDTQLQDHPVVSLIGTLKQHHPELVSMILTERADAGAAIDLINQGQIYRFITKPLNDSQCKIAVTSSLRQHHRLAQNPELHKRYEVERTPEPHVASPVASLLSRVRSLRSWVARRT